MIQYNELWGSKPNSSPLRAKGCAHCTRQWKLPKYACVFAFCNLTVQSTTTELHLTSQHCWTTLQNNNIIKWQLYFVLFPSWKLVKQKNDDKCTMYGASSTFNKYGSARFDCFMNSQEITCKNMRVQPTVLRLRLKAWHSLTLAEEWSLPWGHNCYM